MSGRVQGKIAFITGAARGQGRSHAIRLAQEGADVIAIDLCAPVASTAYAGAAETDLAETVNAVESLGRRIFPALADVRDYDALKAAVDDGVAELGGLDIVAANAGIMSIGNSTELTESMWNDVLDINLTGAWHTAKVAVPHLLAGGRGGSIIMTSSISGLKSYPHLAHYNSAKHGLVGLMKTLAFELAPKAIRVNTIHPSTVDTPMVHNDVMYRLFRPDLDDPTVDDFAAAAGTLNALRVPWIDPVDISNAVLFLASDEARYITGVALPVDAGALLK